jgi:D-serine deaminase-like pyridoxal phosphate-dependent protein
MMDQQKEWYEIEDDEMIDSPSLLFYPDRITHNIAVAKSIIGDVGRLRPHVKTHKTRQVILELMANGITKFNVPPLPKQNYLPYVKHLMCCWRIPLRIQN